MSPTAGGKKQIFISDIHMGDERSMKPSPHPYGWLIKNIAKLTNFLSEQLKDPDVGQVVILGDLFDRWVIPADLPPLEAFDSICSNSDNSGIIDNLKALAKSGKLSYVPGNHDMSLSQEDIPTVEEFFKRTFDGINFICYENNEHQPTGVYPDDDKKPKLVAEHGNMYCVFNAPDIWTNPDSSFLPLGYFISRLVAYKVSKTGKSENDWNIAVKYFHEHEGEPNVIHDLILAVARDANWPRTAPIDMGNISGFAPAITVDEVANKYRELMANWDKDKNHNKNRSWVAIEGDTPLGLSWPAYAYYLGPNTDPNIKVVIFGHTHVSKLIDYSLSQQEDRPLDEPHLCDKIYANSGSWIDNNPCTYIETEVDEDNQLHVVRRKSYPTDVFGQELFVTL
jgi:predicted phosphodiesterase